MSSNAMTSTASLKSMSDKGQPLFSIPKGRSTASSGVWLSILLPLACCPGFYAVHSQCKPSPRILSVLAIQVGISSLHLLYEFYSNHSKSNEISSLKQSKNRLLYLATHPYLPAVVSSIAFFLSTDTATENLGVLICPIICCVVQLKLTKWLYTYFSDSFSLGETLLVGQAGSLTFSLAVKGICSGFQMKTENQQIVLFTQTGIVVATGLSYVMWRLRGKLSIARFLFLLMCVGMGGIVVSSLLLKEWSPVWLVHILSSPTRIALVGWWMNVSVLIILTAIVSQRYQHIPQTILRKTFHVLMVLVMIPGIIMDPSLTYFASTAAMILFLLLEVIRVTRIDPLSGLLNSVFCIFLDEKDGGSLVLSHIYLLAGLSLPLWLYPCDFLHTERLQLSFRDGPEILKIQFSILPLLAGVVSVGIGDTAASIGGTYFGRHRFPSTKKTVEGSVCSAACQLAFVASVVYFGSMNLTLSSWPKLILAIVISTLVEAFTNQVDNVVLPLLLYTPLMDP